MNFKESISNHFARDDIKHEYKSHCFINMVKILQHSNIWTTINVFYFIFTII